MRGYLSAWLGLCAAVAGSACATAESAKTPLAAPPASPQRLRSEALELAELLPSDADRCVAIDPERVPRDMWLRASLLSQVGELPWGLSLTVRAYARAELTPRGDRKRVIELVRFGDASQEQIRAEIERQDRGGIVWGDAPDRCEDAFTCVPVRARFVDAHTVQLTTGEWPYGGAHVENSCAALWKSAPDAFEVSLRRSTSGLSPTRVTDAVLHVSKRGVERLAHRAFEDAAAAERALLAMRTGNEGFSTLSGMPVDEQLGREGNLLSQRMRVSWEELTMVLEDQQRLRVLEGNARAEADAAMPDLDDVEVVRTYADRQMQRMHALAESERKASAEQLAGFLERALRVHPKDEGLARRVYSLKLVELLDARGALAVVDAMLLQGVTDVAGFQLARRAALAHFDEAQLRKELARVHHMTAARAVRMAKAVTQAVLRGEDYEHAEWAFFTADAIDQRAERVRLVDVAPVTVDPSLFLRALAVLASAGGFEGPLGVHVLAHGSVRAQAKAEASVLWSQRIDLDRGQSRVLAATSSTELELVKLGQALRDGMNDGPIELGISLVPMTAVEGNQGPVIRLKGELTANGLVIERGSPSLRLDFEKLLRLVITPLSRLSGATFPPDDLVVDAGTAEEAQRLAIAASQERGARCSVDGFTVTCRGPLDDAHAARTMLVAMTKVVFAREVQGLISHVD